MVVKIRQENFDKKCIWTCKFCKVKFSWSGMLEHRKKGCEKDSS